ncbi:hypothetical protein JQS43_03930 [Natronosporangium hydrolyticum]|uniref:DUF4190 domain-containing protein n=1 Tax=Natronosporangium hydrolyticum TaxID=2811111 RepID=A0A895YJ00_9ACTN|nr:hypothetical protein [Natronosporangium hydrolyticum]QSB15509.1 hypothetical protein JQS43_03930 [Natronosporangium hydrolyticum]
MHPQPPPPPSPRRHPPPPRDAARAPTRVEPLPGTPFGLAIYGAPPASSGPAVGSLVAGIVSVLVSLIVACFGGVDAIAAAEGGATGVGLLVGGAFGLLAGFLGVAAVGLGVVAIRQTRPGRAPAGAPVRGRPMAVAGLVCGGVGVLIVTCSLGLALLALLA